MKTDPARHRLSRPTSGMNRPVQSPMGPRTRFQRAATLPETVPEIVSSISPVEEPTPAYASSPARSDLVSLPPIAEQSPTPPPTSTTSPSLTPSLTPPPPSVPKAITKPLLLAQAPKLNFESVPVNFKALPHEAALWTFDSNELQELVSRALRRSAPESFIRLLSLANLESAIPAEIVQLTASKALKQSQYRFLVQRRSMTLQALSSSFGLPEKSDTEDGASITSQLVLQLSQTSAECDKLLEELLMISDQLSQLASLTEHHWASALAVALRKLNKSYAKRTEDLKTAQRRIIQLEEDLEDAWREAENVAKEIDEIEKVALDSDDEEPVIETAEKVDLSRSRHASNIPPELLIHSRNNSTRIASLPVFSPLSPMPGVSSIPIPETPALHAVMMPALPHDKDDAASIRSTKSVRSWKSSLRSTRDGTRLSLVAAAKTRSQRASKSSLRLNKPRTPIPPFSPLPELPLELIATPLTAARAPSQFLLGDLESRVSTGRSRRTSFDDLRPPRKSVSSYTPTVTMDDIYVRLQSRISDEIQVVPRTPPPPMPLPKALEQPSKTIPSMWLMADSAPKPTPQAVAPVQRRTSSSKQAYNKLKVLTQRYSLPFPLFKSKSSEAQSISPSTSRSAPAGILTEY